MLELYLLILPWWELMFFADDVTAFIWCNIIWSNELTLLGEDRRVFFFLFGHLFLWATFLLFVFVSLSLSIVVIISSPCLQLWACCIKCRRGKVGREVKWLAGGGGGGNEYH